MERTLWLLFDISQTESVEYILITLNEKKKINKRLETVLIRIYRW